MGCRSLCRHLCVTPLASPVYHPVCAVPRVSGPASGPLFTKGVCVPRVGHSPLRGGTWALPALWGSASGRLSLGTSVSTHRWQLRVLLLLLSSPCYSPSCTGCPPLCSSALPGALFFTGCLTSCQNYFGALRECQLLLSQCWACEELGSTPSCRPQRSLPTTQWREELNPRELTSPRTQG